MSDVMSQHLIRVGYIGLVLSVWFGGGGPRIAQAERPTNVPVITAHQTGAQQGHGLGAARGKRMLSPEQVRAAIHAFVKQELAGRAVDCQIVLGEPQQPMAMPPGLIDVQVGASHAEEPLGRRVFLVHVTVNGRFVKTVEATADVAAVLEVIVPVRSIKADEQIEREDVGTERLIQFDLKQGFATTMADVVGKAAIRPLSPQSPIRLTALRKPYAVHKGDRVTIEARQGGLSIQTVGVTKSNGEVGQTITVSNVDSGKDLRATVVAPGVVRVSF